MEKELNLKISDIQFQQLVECFFTGMIRLEELYPMNRKIYRETMKQIFSQAHKFDKEEIVLEMPNGDFMVSQQTEERIVPFFFDDEEF